MVSIFKEQSNKMADQSRTYLRLLYSLVFFIVVAVVVFIKVANLWLFNLGLFNSNIKFIIFIVIAIIIALIFIFPLTNFQYKIYSYSYDEEKIIVTYGIFSKKKKVLPYSVVQDVIVTQGILMKGFKIADVKVVGINDMVTIENIEESLAEKIKENILEKRKNYNIKF